MLIKTLNLQNFRNYTQVALQFQPGLTIITGENAQGKTNLLEAIVMLSLAKSHRTHQDQEMIQWDQKQALIETIIQTLHYETPLSLQLSRKGKIAKVNHLDQAKLSHFIGKLNTVLFAPEDMQLIKGAPTLRRRFMDMELGQARPIYLNTLLQYQRVLKQRNLYLKQFGKTSKFDTVYFDILTTQFIELAEKVIGDRVEFIQQLSALASPIHQRLSNERDTLRLVYMNGSHEYQSLTMEERIIFLRQQADHVYTREIEQGITLFGPHRDDFVCYVNDRKAQFYGSQGQQRTIVLSLKLAEVELIHQLTGEYPVLLLDDVLSELDDERQHLLMHDIENKVQTFLTTATIKNLNFTRLNQADVFHVANGKITKGEKEA